MTQQFDSKPARRARASDSLAADDPAGWPVVKRLLRESMFPNWRILLVAATAMTATAATAGVLPFLLQRVGDELFVAKNERLIYVLPVLVFVVMTFRAAADWVSTVSEAW